VHSGGWERDTVEQDTEEDEEEEEDMTSLSVPKRGEKMGSNLE